MATSKKFPPGSWIKTSHDVWTEEGICPNKPYLVEPPTQRNFAVHEGDKQTWVWIGCGEAQIGFPENKFEDAGHPPMECDFDLEEIAAGQEIYSALAQGKPRS